MSYTIVKKHKITNDKIILDAKIKLTGPKSSKDYNGCFRLIIADVIRDNKVVRMEFITDDFDLAATTICELYKARWDIELFFKQLKQTLKLSDFLGYSYGAELKYTTFSIINCTVHSQKHVQEQILHNG